MTTTLLDRADDRSSVSPAQWLRETTAAVRVSFTTFGVRKTLTVEQKNQAAERVYQSSVTVQSVNTLNASVKTEIGTMEGLSTGYGDAPHWGGN